MKSMVIKLNADPSLKKITNRYVQSGLRYGWKSNINRKEDYGHWNNLILNNSKIEPYDHVQMPYIEKHGEILKIWNLLQQVIGPRSLLRSYINAYTYGTDAYSHYDDLWIREKFGKEALSETFIVYLNDNWNIDWAGETVIFSEDKEIELSVLPKFGRVLMFDSSKLHAARPLSRMCPVLRSILVFKTIDPRVNSQLVEFIKQKTMHVPHSKRTFFEHLFNTMLKLEGLKASEDVCRAGLMHSIYGTEFFKFDGKDIDRNLVKDMIGEYSENIVFQFCSLQNRFENILKNTPGYCNQVHKDLMLLEMANLSDQNATGNYTTKINALDSQINSIKD